MYIKWNLVSPYICPMGRQTVRNVVGYAGKGGRKKRMPICNGSDRGSSFALARKRAHFCLVFKRKKYCKTTCKEVLKDEYTSTVYLQLPAGLTGISLTGDIAISA
ncbi:hypothetical protein E8Q25_23005 [Salmonella enterica]|nr:hypothetical protein [Salmonella enterica subsp. enterica serovar Bonariensis]EAW8022946.1 hypothetical protein [Salmonella enterica]EBF1564452.1 hypothetical protein [Salmonella enterica]EBG9004948.1 hypothetical protein [Salmonella enterica]EBH0505207.1 hypothetical protein [Salmonella enterica]